MVLTERLYRRLCRRMCPRPSPQFPSLPVRTTLRLSRRHVYRRIYQRVHLRMNRRLDRHPHPRPYPIRRPIRRLFLALVVPYVSTLTRMALVTRLVMAAWNTNSPVVRTILPLCGGYPLLCVWRWREYCGGAIPGEWNADVCFCCPRLFCFYYAETEHPFEDFVEFTRVRIELSYPDREGKLRVDECHKLAKVM